MTAPVDSFSARCDVPGHPGTQFMSLPRAEAAGAGPLARLPYSLRVLAEHLLRHEDGRQVTADDVRALGQWVADGGRSERSVAFFPGRILMQDSAGLPVLADLAALAEAVEDAGGSAASVAPRLRSDLVIDHSIEVDFWGSNGAEDANIAREFTRNDARYRFVRWAEGAFPTLRVVPPGIGICHQLNLEVLADVVAAYPQTDGTVLAGCDSLLGTDSHTTMINALAVFGWGVGGIEAAAALVGEPVVLRIPEVVGVRLAGGLSEATTATDFALAMTAALREHDLVGRIVEFCGPGVARLSVPDRATIANMAPEYGATMGFFPADVSTIDYLRVTGRPEADVARAEAFLAAQGLMAAPDAAEPVFTRMVDFDLGTVEPTVAGPRRPQERRRLSEVAATLPPPSGATGLDHGDVVIAAITSCTNTSNPRALAAAGILAKKAVARGLKPRSRIKTSFAPGSRVASGMLEASGLQAALDALGFHVVGHGCMTCMGNSGPLEPGLAEEIKSRDLSVAAVLSGNRNFEGRVHPSCRLGYLASPPLVVAYALAGTMRIDLSREPVGLGADGVPVHLSDLWPSRAEVDAVVAEADVPGLSAANRIASFEPPASWRALGVPPEGHYAWEGTDGFIRRPPFLSPDVAAPQLEADLIGARPLLVLGDAITTDHISPVARVMPDSEAGLWLKRLGVSERDLGSFSSRRLNHEVMLRGGFANIRLRNQLADGREGGFTRLLPDGGIVPVHEAAEIYTARGVPMVVVAGSGYGAGSARDWAAKVTRLLGVAAVIAGSFERIHRSNLVAFGVLPLQLPEGVRLALDGSETLDITGLPDAIEPDGTVRLTVHRPGAPALELDLTCRIDTAVEAQWLRAGGVLPKVVAEAVAGGMAA